MPFLALAVFFIVLGLVLRDQRQLVFGIVWLGIAAFAAYRRRHER
jgi:hypothetical protein